jgi:UrcA family protein
MRVSIHHGRRDFMTTLTTSRAHGRGFKSALLLLIGGLAVAAASAAAGASPAERDTPTAIIHYTTASLATDSGVRALYRRIEMAAEKVCPHEPANSQLPNEALIKCRHDTIAAAIAKVNNQRLVAYHVASAH